MITPILFGVGLALIPSFYAAPADVERPGPSCCSSSIPKPRVPGAKILSLTSRVRSNLTVHASSPTLTQEVAGLNICEVNVTLTHHGANDTVLVQTWLPLARKAWNNRFAGIGGGAWLAGQGKESLAVPASLGYAVSTTDGGLPGGNALSPELWALKSDGTVNHALLENFASRSIHDLAVVGKAVTASFYGKHAARSYWNGCSTGGRQGLVAAQKYPHDFDGIVAAAPATYWTEYVIAELWPQVVMRGAGLFPPPCEVDAIVQAAISACDGLDDVKDGVINDPSKCNFDPFSAVGTKTQCQTDLTTSRTVRPQTAAIVRKIWDGPRTPSGKKLWPGLPIGASLGALAYTTPSGPNGSYVGQPFFVADAWARFFVKADPKFDTTQLNSASLTELFFQSKRKFNNIIGSSNPDLSKFKRSGGKLLVWHGLADQLIFPQGTVQYFHQVERALGGRGKADDFFGLFLAPGGDHCGYDPTSSGAIPTDPLAAVVSWVEKGKAPRELQAETLSQAPSHFTRKICRYLLTAKYKGSGNATLAENYRCVYP